jgi:hypothetical protein
VIKGSDERFVDVELIRGKSRYELRLERIDFYSSVQKRDLLVEVYGLDFPYTGGVRNLIEIRLKGRILYDGFSD